MPGDPDMVTVQCFPFYSVLLAVGRTQIDFFSLDVEGHELKILQTIPWHKVDIKVRTFLILTCYSNIEAQLTILFRKLYLNQDPHG